jgi:hypothetical protein
MKSLIFCLALLSAAPALAGGKITVEPAYNLSVDGPEMRAGLSIWQKLIGKTFFEGFAGMGLTSEITGPEADRQWMSLKAGLGYEFEPGFQMQLGYENMRHHKPFITDNIVYLRLSYQLW